jgi:peptide/nickel transport system permease protein
MALMGCTSLCDGKSGGAGQAHHHSEYGARIPSSWLNRRRSTAVGRRLDVQCCRVASFLIRRAVQGVVTLWVIWSLVFVAYFMAPGDPAAILCRPGCPVPILQKIRETLGLNQPLWHQYLDYFGRIFHGNLGYSYGSGAPVSSIVLHAIPVDLSLAIPAALIWLTVGIGVGTAAARRPTSRRARAATVLVLAGLSIPTFIFGNALVYVFDGILFHSIDLFPRPGESWTPLLTNPLQWAHGLILPWITLAVVSSATYVRLSRSSMRDVLGEDYITAARARGIVERRVIYRHAMRAAIAPVLTQFGIDVATVLGGAIITEVVFDLPGLGRTMVEAVLNEDRPVVQGVVLVTSAFIVVANIIVDALHAVIDPRLRVA